MEKSEMMNHTKEPWVTENEFIDSAEGYAVARCRWDNGDQGEEDAKRIVACVNACEGITTEALEAGVVACAIDNLSNSLPDGEEQFYFGDVKVWEDV